MSGNEFPFASNRDAALCFHVRSRSFTFWFPALCYFSQPPPPPFPFYCSCYLFLPLFSALAFHFRMPLANCLAQVFCVLPLFAFSLSPPHSVSHILPFPFSTSPLLLSFIRLLCHKLSTLTVHLPSHCLSINTLCEFELCINATLASQAIQPPPLNGCLRAPIMNSSLSHAALSNAS